MPSGMDLLDDTASALFLSSSPGRQQPRSHTPKRTASQAELHSNDTRQPKVVKRRAPQACESCRARKVRCNVAKHGAPCSNCVLDEVECVVGENRRKKKRDTDGAVSTLDRRPLPLPGNFELGLHPVHQPLQQSSGDAVGQQAATISEVPNYPNAHMLPSNVSTSILPAYIKPLPDRFGEDDIIYLQNKGALTIPSLELRNELLRCYFEYTHPFMPLLDWYRFVRTVDQDHVEQPMSLLLFQAVMFAGVATVDMQLLRGAGFGTRREARRAFFNKVRLLYDLDYEDDSVTLVQALLLMTYWRENPNGRKETHHWIELAVPLSRKVGLHRSSEAGTLEQRKLWKRIWWSTYMRDAQIALGTRRATLIKDVDFDVPMLELDDFDLEALPRNCCISHDCNLARDVEMQRQLAVMCIEKAKLCLCISHILSTQFRVTNSKGSMRTASMVFENCKSGDSNHMPSISQVVQNWKDRLSEAAKYSTPSSNDFGLGGGPLILNCAFLHMLYYATVFTWHRSQLLPSAQRIHCSSNADALDESRKAVRAAATNITSIATTLQRLNLVRYLPSPTITVLLPAIVVHLLDLLALDKFVHRESLQDFCKCMQVMAALRDMYAAADYSTAFLQAAIRNTEIGPITLQSNADRDGSNIITEMSPPTHTEPPAIAQLTRRSDGQNSDPLLQTNGAVVLSHSETLDRNADQRPESFLTSGATSSSVIRPQPLTPAAQHLDLDARVVGNNKLLMDPNSCDGVTSIDAGRDVGVDSFSETHIGPSRSTFDLNEEDLGEIVGLNNDFAFDDDWLMGVNAEGLMLDED